MHRVSLEVGGKKKNRRGIRLPPIDDYIIQQPTELRGRDGGVDMIER